VEERVVGVSLGFEHSGCVTESGHVYTWGNNYYGRLGLGDENNRYSPTLVEALAGEFCVQISCGGYHTMAINREGQLYVWGKADARLGLGSMGRGEAYGDASGGGKSVCVPRLHHLLGAKSYNERLNHRERRFGGAAAAAGGGERPMQGEEGGSSKDTVVVQCCAAFEHSMVMTSTGQVLTFGLNTAGKLGIGTNLSIGGHNGGSELQVSIPSRQSHGYFSPNIHVPPFEVPLF